VLLDRRGPRRRSRRRDAGVPPGAPLDVLLVGRGAPERGGIPTSIDRLLGSDLARRHRLRFLNLAPGTPPQGGRATRANVARTVTDALAVRRAAAGADLVHVHSALAPAVTLLRAALLVAAARSRGCGVVVHAHGGGILAWASSARRRLLLRLLLGRADRVVAVWEAGRRALGAALPAPRVVRVDNGVDLDRPPAAHRPTGRPRLLFVGLLTPRKGVLDLARASELLTARGVAHELVLLGGTPDEGPAAEAEVRRRLPAGVRLLGTREPRDVPPEYAAADVFCLPSWWEAMPLSVLEAMAAGLPVVATDVGDVGRAVVDGVTGRVVPPRSPEALADALEPLLRDGALRRRAGAAGRAHVARHFGLDASVAALDAVYAEVAGLRRR
jgi:glycosyltransferase involved in cell wall biosynthesis